MQINELILTVSEVSKHIVVFQVLLKLAPNNAKLNMKNTRAVKTEMMDDS